MEVEWEAVGGVVVRRKLRRGGEMKVDEVDVVGLVVMRDFVGD